jgi:hypothetical protein
LTESTQHTATWPTTIGAACIVVGGLSLFGGCLSFTGMSEIEQLHSAIPFGEGEMSEEVYVSLASHAPPAWVSSIASMLVILFSLTLIGLGVSLQQRDQRAVKRLIWWSVLYTTFTVAIVCINWVPRMDLVSEHSTVQALFLAQLIISLPLYLLLPVFLLIFLNCSKVYNELTLWR